MTHNTKLVLATLTAVAGLGAGVFLAPQLTNSALADETLSLGQAMRMGAKVKDSAAWQSIQTAMDNQDFEAWQTAREEMRQERQNMAQQRHQTMTDLINSQEAFDKWIEARNLRKAGDLEGSKALLEELGFTDQTMPGMGGRGGGRGMGGHSGNCPNLQ